jgi:hypothetical protein
VANRVVVFPRGKVRGERGTWWPTVEDGGKHRAIVTCWCCGNSRTIGERVDSQGFVTPPYWCDPAGGCSFRENIKLAGWIP